MANFTKVNTYLLSFQKSNIGDFERPNKNVYKNQAFSCKYAKGFISTTSLDKE